MKLIEIKQEENQKAILSPSQQFVHKGTYVSVLACLT